MYIFRGRGVFIDVYKADDKIATSGTTSLADLDLRRTYRAIDSVATGRIPSLFCALSVHVLTSKLYILYTIMCKQQTSIYKLFCSKAPKHRKFSVTVAVGQR